MLTLYGRSTSDSVQKALWALGEAGQSFEHVPLGGSFGGLDEPQYLAMNPHGSVPTLRDDDVVVWESNAIIRYLAAKYSSDALWPEDVARRAYVDQWMSWGQVRLYGDSNRLFWLTIRTPTDQQDAFEIGRVHERVMKYLRLLDTQLSKQAYVAGERLTMADIPCGAPLYRYFNLPIERETLPNLERWYALLTQRAPYQKAVMVSFEELRGRLAF